ncbi:GFA family protein [Aureimonas mangrovi]|uniref:GFA family protein n=1 Tax=Aureimonas mangrovi TaxID=2758041 RepID=UPI00163DBCBC|nr:GFA family protein [Aureimonas mangrovi]
MSIENGPVHTGGCQCGAVRFRLEGEAEASICHCRMCQKAFGGFYAPLVSARKGHLTWTKAEPARFRSSSLAERGFCPQCGTPLTYETPDGVALAHGAFDDPAAITPTLQYGLEARLPFIGDLDALPGTTTEEDAETDTSLRGIRSYQHPDHD